MTTLVVAALGLAFTLGFGAGVVVTNRLRLAQLAERDRRIVELETQLHGDGPRRNGRWHGPSVAGGTTPLPPPPPV
jgi:hypothetical protein